MSAAIIYAKELERLQRGLALWQPEPPKGVEPVRLGDVGFVRDGCFIRLFNARVGNDVTQIVDTSDSDLSLNPLINRMGVPKDFCPIELDASIFQVNENVLAAGAYWSKAVSEHSINFDADATSAPIGASLQYCCQSQTGAVLAFRPAAEHHQTLQTKVMQQYMWENYESWYQFAEEKGIGVEFGDIIFVYGVTQTATWANACFTEKDRKYGVSLKGGYLPLASANVSLSGSWDHESPVERHSGPSRYRSDRLQLLEDPPMDQTLFLKSFKIARKWTRLKMKAAAEPLDLPDADMDDDDTCSGSSVSRPSSVEMQSSPDLISTPHPCDELLHCILESSSATLAMASDDDIEMLTLWMGKLGLDNVRLQRQETFVSLNRDYISVIVGSDGRGVVRILSDTPQAQSALEEVGAQGPMNLAKWLCDHGAVVNQIRAQNCKSAESSHDILSPWSTLDWVCRPSAEVADDGWRNLSSCNLAFPDYAATEDACFTRYGCWSSGCNTILPSCGQSNTAILSGSNVAARERSPQSVRSTLPVSKVRHIRCPSTGCGECFQDQNQYNRHKQTHGPKTWMKCPYCDVRKVEKTNLELHVFDKHPDAKPHKCRWCSERFADESDCTKHQKQVQEPPKQAHEPPKQAHE